MNLSIDITAPKDRMRVYKTGDPPIPLTEIEITPDTYLITLIAKRGQVEVRAQIEPNKETLNYDLGAAIVHIHRMLSIDL